MYVLAAFFLLRKPPPNVVNPIPNVPSSSLNGNESCWSPSPSLKFGSRVEKGRMHATSAGAPEILRAGSGAALLRSPEITRQCKVTCGDDKTVLVLAQARTQTSVRGRGDPEVEAKGGEATVPTVYAACKRAERLLRQAA